MAQKKTFKRENPALSFISTPAEEVPPDASRSNEKAELNSKAQTPITTRQKPPKGYKFNPLYIETKSRRVQLLLQPSTVDTIKSLAKEKGLSMNETINEAIQEYLQREGK